MSPNRSKYVTDDVAAQRFSDAGAAKRWSDLYTSKSTHLFEENFRLRRDATVDRVLDLLPPQGVVLDLGCGAAPVICELRRRNIPCIGLDSSEDMLRHARDRLREEGLSDEDMHQGDCRATPFRSESFDVVVCLGVVSYVENMGEVYAEIDRLLKPGGHALVSFRNKGSEIFCDPARAMRLSLISLLRGRPTKKFVGGRRLDRKIVAKCADEQGFQVVDFVGIGFGPFKFNNWSPFSQRTSISLSDYVTRFLQKLHWNWAFRAFADISLCVYRKQAQP